MTGAVLLGLISVVAVSDMLLALYFRSLANRVEGAETVSGTIEPEGARSTATVMFVAAPVMSLVIALISFGVIPSGIEPVRF